MAAARFTSDSAAGSTISEAIQNLPTELRERILKEHLAIKIRERKAMGWGDVHIELSVAPICEKRERIVKVLFCRKCYTCCRNGLCSVCFENGVVHYPGAPLLNVYDYEEIFYKYLLSVRKISLHL